MHFHYNTNDTQILIKSKNKIKLRVIFLTLSFLLVCSGYILAIIYLPDNPVPVSYSLRHKIQSILPQGWAFFMRNAREKITYVYKKDSKGKWNLVNVPGASPKYLFGLNRKGRAISVEISLLRKQISENDWISSRVPVNQLLDKDTLKYYGITDNAPNPLCDGDIAIQTTTILPWAWAGSFKKLIMPYKIICLHVRPTYIKN